MQDIVYRPAASETVVVSIWPESQRSEELALLGDDADVGVGNEKVDLPVLVRGTDADVAEPAQVAQGDRAEAVDFVAADVVVDRRWLVEGLGFDECVEDGHRCLPVEGAVRPDVVVVSAEDVELVLQLGQRPGRPLAVAAFEKPSVEEDVEITLRDVRAFLDDPVALLERALSILAPHHDGEATADKPTRN